MLRWRRALVGRPHIVGVFTFMGGRFLLVLLVARRKSLLHWHLLWEARHPLSHTHHLSTHGSHPSHWHSLHIHIGHAHDGRTHRHSRHHSTIGSHCLSIVCLHTLIPLSHEGRRHSSVHRVYHAS